MNKEEGGSGLRRRRATNNASNVQIIRTLVRKNEPVPEPDPRKNQGEGPATGKRTKKTKSQGRKWREK